MQSRPRAEKSFPALLDAEIRSATKGAQDSTTKAADVLAIRLMNPRKASDMDKEERIEQLQEDLGNFAADYPRTTLSILAGWLVGLLEHHIEEQGGDPAAEIKIDGEGKRRDITISARIQPTKNED